MCGQTSTYHARAASTAHASNRSHGQGPRVTRHERVRPLHWGVLEELRLAERHDEQQQIAMYLRWALGEMEAGVSLAGALLG